MLAALGLLLQPALHARAPSLGVVEALLALLEVLQAPFLQLLVGLAAPAIRPAAPR